MSPRSRRFDELKRFLLLDLEANEPKHHPDSFDVAHESDLLDDGTSADAAMADEL